MVGKFAFVLPFALSYFLATAQDEVTVQKRSNHYVGVQANQLARQLLNFGGSASAIDNPYLITYAVNSVRSGWGLNCGLGYTHLEERNENPFTPIETTINDFFIRLGIERKVSIGKKWLTSYGMDLLRESKKNITTTNNSQSGDFNTETRNTGTGVGLRFTLNYNITEKLLAGTEATYYYKSTKEIRNGTNIPEQTEKSKDVIFKF